MHRFDSIIDGYSKTTKLSHEDAWCLVKGMKDVFAHMKHHDEEKFWEVMKDIHVSVKGKYFDEHYAKHEVSEMYHIDKRGSKVSGEIYSVEECMEIHRNYERYYLDKQCCHWDTYVAINAYHHDHVNMFKAWFTEDEVKSKVVEGAITFWFKDEDSEPGKVWKYFHD